MRRLVRSAIVGAIAAAATAPLAPLAAQGALSLQGFGYPTGQLSTRAAGTAGALGETDAGSPLNPAALPGGGRTFFSFQIDPEFRSVKTGTNTVNTNVVRFPAIAIGAKVFSRGFLGASFSSLLDRTWDASYDDSVLVSGQKVRSTVATSVRGAISDARLAFAWQFSERLQAGLAFHALSGANRLILSRTFTDSATFGPLVQNSTLSYSGSAVSGGVVVLPLPHVFVAASGRIGGAMATRYGDSVATRGKAPNRYGLSVVYDGIPGSQIAVRYNRDLWSRMRSLGSSSLQVNDATELSAGLDVAGPKFQAIPTQFRLGARTRDLPFGFAGSVVKEKTLAVGGQLTVARGWASVDVSLQRSTRTAAGVSERGTSLSVGLTVRP
ncbi:MAG: hypothetical protein ACYC3L_02195 [Gemmatimonadaceae bacterium]